MVSVTVAFGMDIESQLPHEIPDPVTLNRYNQNCSELLGYCSVKLFTRDASRGACSRIEVRDYSLSISWTNKKYKR